MGLGVMKTVDASIGLAEKFRDYMLLKHTNFKVKQYAKLSNGENQSLDVYWDDNYVETQAMSWGEGTVWNEIQYLLANAEGKVLDIACGAGGPAFLMARYKKEMYSF